MENLVFKQKGNFVLVENSKGKYLFKMRVSKNTNDLINSYYREKLFPKRSFVNLK